MKKRYLLFSISFLLFFSSCQNQETKQPLSFSAMDTAVTIQCYGKDAEKAKNKLKQTILSCDELFSKTKENSDVSRINREHTVPLEELNSATRSMLHTSDRIFSLTNGTFDPSLGALISLWGIGTNHQKVPESEEIHTALAACGWEQVSLSNDTIAIPDHMSLDFGAIAKGVTTNELYRILEQFELDGAVISLGGNILVTGEKTDGELWRVGISDPQKESDYIGYLTVTDVSVVTSGNYERYFESNGTRYHHILDPSTGFPSDSGLSSVTVISPDAALADGFSTALFILGPERGMELTEQTPDLEAVFISEDGTVSCSSGIRSAFTLTETNRFILSQP